MNRLLFILIIAGPLPNLVVAQETEKDFEVWLKTDQKFNLGQRLDFTLEEQLRFDEYASAVKTYHFELETKFEVYKNIDLLFTPRFIRRNDNQGSNQGYENRFRYQVGAGYKHKLSQWRFKHRIVFQDRNDMGISESEGDIPVQTFRFRSGIEYKIKNWSYDPEVRFEYFLASNASKTGRDDAIRFSVGTSKDYDIWGEFGFFYMYERTVNPLLTAEIDHILQFSYSYTF